MKKVLILAYDFPPYVSVGAQRPYSWLLYFKENGLCPIVITRQWDNKFGNHLDYIAPSISNNIITDVNSFGTVIKTPYFPNLSNKLMLKYGAKKFVILRKIISAFFELFQYFFKIGPKSQIYFAAKKYIEENEVSCIIATGEPFVLFSYASLLSRNFKIPWVADYRDPWSQDKSRGNNFFRKKLDIILEKRIVNTASFVSTVSEFFKSQIQFSVPSKRIEIIQNGFESENLKAIEGINQFNKCLTIGFVGTIYKWHPFEIFLKTINEFLEANPNKNINIRLYGTNLTHEQVSAYTAKYSALKERIILFHKLQNIELLKKMAEDNLMLLFNYYSYMGTKIYDYLAVRRKILFCFKEDKEAQKLKFDYYNMELINDSEINLQEELLLETNAGIIIKDSIHLKSILHDLYNEFEKDGEIVCNSRGIEKYSRKKHAEIFAKKIKQISN